MNILFVCMGNICRSPMAEGLFRHKIEKAGLSESVMIDSAGMVGHHAGEPPDERAQEKMLSYGIDISAQRSRQFEIQDFDQFDLIFAMDDRNLSDLYDEVPEVHYKEKVSLLLTLAPELKTTTVPDPYWGKEDGFEHVYQLLDSATDVLLDKLKAKNF